MNNLTLRSTSPAQTVEIGKIIGVLAEPNTVITLSGDLGAGKTWLAKGIAYGLGAPDYEYVNSPAYDLAHEYQGRLKVFHLDLYRLETFSIDDLVMFQDFYQAGGVCLIEWPSRLEAYPSAYPTEHLAIHLESPDAKQADVRDLQLTARGDRHQNLLNRVKAQIP